jgi:uncharacterized membrane protein
MIESLLEAIDRILSQGKFSWGAIITALLFFNKIQRNKEFRLRDQRVERNQRRIMDHLGVEGEWPIPQRTLPQMVQQNLRKLYSSSPKETQQGNQRRKTKMNSQNINYATLIPTILGAAKLILQTFGIEIPDTVVNEIVNGAAAVGTVIGIFMAHRKQVLVPAPQNPNEHNQSF